MAQNRLNFIFICSFMVLCLFAITLSRRPLCIDSMSVQRLDRVTERTDTLFSCRLNRDVSYPLSLMGLKQGLESRLKTFEGGLLRMGIELPATQVTVSADNPYAFQSEGSRITIGEELLRAKGHLERGLLLSWLQGVDPESSPWRRQVLADLMIEIVFGGFELRDPIFERGLSLRAESPMLPAFESLCTSSWRPSALYESCLRDAALKPSMTTETTLRGVFSSALARSYRSLSFADRMLIARRMRALAPANHAKGAVLVGDEVSKMFAEASSFERELQLRIGRLGETGERWNLALLQELRRRGVPEDSETLAIETLIVDERENVAAEILTSAGGSFAVLRGNQLFFPPSQEPFSPPKNLKARNLVWIGCGDLSFGHVLDLDDGARKFLAVKSCSDAKVDLKPWMRGDVSAFTKANPTVSFVVFDLPSLRSKGKSLDRTQNIWSKIERGLEDETLRDTFGWRSIEEWKNSGLLKPRAFIDAIEWFRLN